MFTSARLAAALPDGKGQGLVVVGLVAELLCNGSDFLVGFIHMITQCIAGFVVDD